MHRAACGQLYRGRFDFLEMTACVFDSCVCIWVYVRCIYVMHYECHHRAKICERKW